MIGRLCFRIGLRGIPAGATVNVLAKGHSDIALLRAAAGVNALPWATMPTSFITVALVLYFVAWLKISILTRAMILVLIFGLTALNGAEILHRTHASKALGRNEEYTLIVPEGSRPRPLLVLLHGAGRNHKTLIDHESTRRALLATDSIVLMPNGRNSWWLGGYGSFVMELVAMVRKQHRTTQATIGGWSMGGFGSLRILSRYPEEFDAWFGVLAVTRGKTRRTPLPPVGRFRGKRLHFITGDKAYDRRMNEELSAKLKAAGIPHTFRIIPGEHKFDVVEQAFQPAAITKLDRIWDQAPHNAFTDLVRFRDSWYCVFREGKAHVSEDGRLRILRSRDGAKWSSAALVASELGDLRDAKIVVTPGGKLQLNGAAALKQPSRARHQSLVWLSENGTEWTREHPVADPDFWLWRTTWHQNVAWGFGYNTNPNRNLRSLRLYSSADGRVFEPRMANAGIANSPGENTIRFDRDGTAICLLRRDPYTGRPPIPESAATAMIGTASTPYVEWNWKDTGIRIGGPNFIVLPDGRRLAAIRLHDGATRTSLGWLDETTGKLTEFLKLPSSGDSSYAGLVWHEGALHISYYSTHEGGKSSIYFAVVNPL